MGKHWTISDDHHTPHPKSFNPSPFLQWPRSFSGLHPKGLTPLSTWWSLWKPGAYEPQSTGFKHHNCHSWMLAMSPPPISPSVILISGVMRNHLHNIGAWKAVLATCLSTVIKHQPKATRGRRGPCWLTVQVAVMAAGTWGSCPHPVLNLEAEGHEGWASARCFLLILSRSQDGWFFSPQLTSSRNRSQARLKMCL